MQLFELWEKTTLSQKIFELRSKGRLLQIEEGNWGKSTGRAYQSYKFPLREHIPHSQVFRSGNLELFVDYEAKHIGPLSDQEVGLILKLRKIKDPKLQNAIHDLLERCLAEK